MEPQQDRERRAGPWDQGLGPGVVPLGEVIPEVLDRGSRHRRDVKDVLEDFEDPPGREYRARSPTNSERLNRALVELSLSAFKVHTLIWKWRGAPARGVLPFFTIRSLEKFCHLTRPTIRTALLELTSKGWIERLPYNPHHKNTLFRLVPVRKIPPPPEAVGK
ncbi:hypothetical protein ES703_116807 [subsurface metagenome]